MGYTTSTIHGIEVPDSSEANNVPEDIGKVVTALEAGAGQAADRRADRRAHVAAEARRAGRLQHDDEPTADQRRNQLCRPRRHRRVCAGIANAALPKAGGTMSGAIAMGGSGDRSGCGHRQRRRCSLRTTDPEVGFGAGQVWRLVWHD